MRAPPEITEETTDDLTDELLRQRGFLRALARRLLRDEARAEDAVQDTLVLALERGPRAGASLRGWLAGTLRHLAWKQRRAEGRRAQRERRAARPEAADAQVRGELEAGARLYAALQRLEEPFRTAVVLRYAHGLTPGEIAARLELPLATVKSRLRRGLAKLRGELNVEPDARRALALLAGAPTLAPPPSVSIPEAIGGLAMTAKGLKTAGIVTAALVALVAWRVVAGGGPDPRAARVEEAAHGAEPNPGAGGMESMAGRAEEAAGRELAGASPRQAAAPSARRGRGRVLDVHGRPVPFVEVERRHLAGRVVARVEADGEGRFPLEGPAGDWEYGVETERWTSLAVGRESAGIETPLVVVAPVALLAGRTVDPAGEPVAKASVGVSSRATSDWTAAFEGSLEGSEVTIEFVRTDEAGRFELRAPVLPGAMLRACSPTGWPTVWVEAPAVTTRGMELVIPARPAPMRPVAGTVLDPQGRPLEGATVQLGPSVCLSDALGRFEVDGAGPEPDAPLRVVAPGFRLLQLPEPRAALGWPTELVLRLPGPALAIEGRVVDERGEPLADRSVRLVDPTPFGLDASSRYASVEQLASARPFLTATTDARGRFRLDGLEQREYTLVADDSPTLRVARATVPAGTSGLELRLGDEPAEALAGMARAPDGTPLAGVVVRPARPVAPRVSPTPGDETVIQGAGVATDAQGRFALPAFPSAVDRLVFQGTEVVPTTLAIPTGAARDALELVVPRRARLRVELGARWSEVDRFRVVDAAGERVDVWIFEADSWGQQPTGYLSEGRSPVYTVPEGAAAELVLMQGRAELEVHRAPVAIPPGGPTTVRID